MFFVKFSECSALAVRELVTRFQNELFVQASANSQIGAVYLIQLVNGNVGGNRKQRFVPERGIEFGREFAPEQNPETRTARNSSIGKTAVFVATSHTNAELMRHRLTPLHQHTGAKLGGAGAAVVRFLAQHRMSAENGDRKKCE